MAVQAQYPSNVLLLNRGIQEGNNDYSMPPQAGGGAGTFLDQPHLLFNNTPPVNKSTNNPRKRGRDMNAAINSRLSSSMHHHQLIDLTQLHTPSATPPPNAVVSTGLRLSFGDQQQNHSILSLLQQDIATQIKHQTDEIDQFLQAQTDQMRRTLAEKRQAHYRGLINTAEEAVTKRMREKEAEVEEAVCRNSDLQARAAHFSAEAQVWQARARAQEATAAALQAQLQNAIMSRGCAPKQEGPLTCASGEGLAEDAESVYIDPERVEVWGGPSCKACQKRVASVVLLPCRHLCVCLECDGVVSSCPLCFSFKSSSVEVSLGQRAP